MDFVCGFGGEERERICGNYYNFISATTVALSHVGIGIGAPVGAVLQTIDNGLCGPPSGGVVITIINGYCGGIDRRI